MKRMKQLATLLLVLVMMLSMAVPAMAVTGGKITVNNAKPNETYRIYKILDLSLNAEKGAFTYTLPENSPWTDFFKDADTGMNWFSLDELSRVVVARSTLNETTKYEFVEDALLYADSHEAVTPLESITCGKDETTVLFDELELGYYLIDTTVGTAVIVETNNLDLNIADKSSGPCLDKQVEEDSTSIFGDKNTADIGQVVNFKVEISSIQKLHKVDMRDTMSAGLTFNPASVKVYRNSVAEGNLVQGETNPGVIGSGGTWYLVDKEHHSPDFGEEHLGKNTFHIHFRDSYINELGNTEKLIVVYSATVNDNAVVGGNGNPNEAYLAYGSAQETNHDNVITYTWQLPIFKYAKGASNANMPLAGAKFILERIKVDRTTAVDADGTMFAIIDASNNCTGWTAEKNKATVLTTGEDGMITVNGLDSDYYQLIETDAPAGYNKLTAPVEFSISEEGVLRSGSATVSQITVENKTGTELPSTGGTGTTVMYIAGAVLMVGAAVLMITKKRMNEN